MRHKYLVGIIALSSYKPSILKLESKLLLNLHEKLNAINVTKEDFKSSNMYNINNVSIKQSKEIVVKEPFKNKRRLRQYNFLISCFPMKYIYIVIQRNMKIGIANKSKFLKSHLLASTTYVPKTSSRRKKYCL